jgi:CDP-diacylglycerol--serine O-phosphatidyltransferase
MIKKIIFDKNSHFNLANLFTMVNIASGSLAIYFITHQNFFLAATFAWIGGAFDIFDGKIARKYGLSSEFGIQLDSYADFLSFVIVPTMFMFFAIYENSGISLLVVAVVSIYYIIAGLRRLIDFNLKSDEGEVAKYFEGVPTPLGGILLWVLYLIWLATAINPYILIGATSIIGALLNSKVKIPHP